MRTQKGQQWLFRVGTFAICFMLTGCGHEHTWVEATCTEPKTCSECGKTEGEALGHTWVEATCAEPKHCSVCGETEGVPLAHTWVEATCAEPKHCSVCGETEGEPLEHTLTEANYQQAATCEVCGVTVGEPLQADFEKEGLVCDAEQNIEYSFTIPVTTSEYGGHYNIGKVTFSDYKIFDSDDKHEALEGYEWREITMTETFDQNAAYTLMDTGVTPVPVFTDYYCNFSDTYNESTDTFTLNYNGKDYTEVKYDGEVLDSTWNDDICTIRVRMLCRVPKGYDGLVMMVGDAESADILIISIADRIKSDNVYFRLK